MEGKDQGHNSQQQSQLAIALIIREADSCKQETNTLPNFAVYFADFYYINGSPVLQKDQEVSTRWN